MKLSKTIRTLERVDYLIRTRSTGNPRSFARRLDLSERQLYRLIDELRCNGFPIEYSPKEQQYFYSGDVKLTLRLLVSGEKINW
jgi:predicted DNA-binding transcriptional regulator YafY